MAGTSYQILEVESFCDRERAKLSPIKMTSLTFQMKNSTKKLSWLNILENTRKNLKLNLVLVDDVLKSKAL